MALLDDVNVLLPQNNEVLQFNSVSGKWENKSITGYTHKVLYRYNPTLGAAQFSLSATINGLSSSIPFLMDVAGASFIVNGATDVFQINSIYQLQILKAG